jgi:hypothetical protein
MSDLLNWLLEGDPWVKYRTMLDILELPENDQSVLESKERILTDPRIINIFNQLYDWPSTPLNSHKSAGHPIHKLSFLADIGLTIEDEPIKRITDQILRYQSEEGSFQVLMNIPKHFGGTGENQLAWALCDSPLILYSLIRFGLHDHPQVKRSVKFLISQIQESGYPCKVSKELGNFRGPGKKSDPCPYANLLMLKVFSAIQEGKNSKECQMAIDVQLDLLQNSLEKHPYMFYTGTDFRKLKAPFIWYDLLHVLDVLSGFDEVIQNKNFIGMVDLLRAKSTDNLRYVPESIWKAWSDFEFGQKKQPSQWLTFMVLRILKRVNIFNNK